MLYFYKRVSHIVNKFVVYIYILEKVYITLDNQVGAYDIIIAYIF